MPFGTANCQWSVQLPRRSAFARFATRLAFPLLTYLLCPYPGRQIPLSHQLFNYRLSRARRMVENAFGILAARWRVFHTKIALAPQNVNEIVKASSVLHNFIMTQPTSSTSVQQLLEDAPSLSQAEGIRLIRGVGNRAGHEALFVRDSFREFFAQDNSVSWQYNHVTRGTFENDWSAFMATNIDDCCRHLKIIFIFKLVIMTLFWFNHCWMLVIIPNLMGCIKITNHWNNWQSRKLNMKSCKLYRP